MIGSAENAKTAFEIFLAGDAAYPDGWECVGSGLYRTAYLGPDDVVYKVQHDADGQYPYPVQQNVKEYANMCRYSDRPWAIQVSLYAVDVCEDDEGKLYQPPPVIAAEYVTGETAEWAEECYGDDVDGFIWPTPEARAMYADAYSCINDLHNENFRLVDDYTIKVMDAAGG